MALFKGLAGSSLGLGVIALYYSCVWLKLIPNNEPRKRKHQTLLGARTRSFCNYDVG